MASRLVFETERVVAFVGTIIDMVEAPGMTAIGLEHNGELVAGVLYEGFNGRNIWMHVAAVPGRHWLNREFLYAAFRYPFLQCGVDRISISVDASNTEAIRFDEHIGFTPEARLVGAAKDGGDTLIYVMRKSECKYVDPK